MIYAYDHRGRMVTKALCSSAPLRLIKTTTCIWDNNSGASFDRLGLLTQSNGCKCYEHSFVHPSGKEESYVIKQKWQECSKR